MIRAASVLAASLILSAGVARAQEETPPAALWYAALQPSFWVGGTDGEGRVDQRGTGEGMVRLELAVHREPAGTGATFAFGDEGSHDAGESDHGRARLPLVKGCGACATPEERWQS